MGPFAFLEHIIPVLLAGTLGHLEVSALKTVLDRGEANRIGAGHVNMGVKGLLFADFVTHAPVDARLKFFKLYFDKVMGEALFQWIVDGNLPLACACIFHIFPLLSRALGTCHTCHKGCDFLRTAIIGRLMGGCHLSQKCAKGNTNLSTPPADC